jgi:membrane protease YdiL (CAAX protease family)
MNVNAAESIVVQPDSSVGSDSSESLPTAAHGGWLRRWAEGIVFVAVWIGLGWGFALDANAYLLAGIPLTIVFQRFVRGAPLQAMWVREAPPVGRGWIGPAVPLAILPAVSLVESLGRREWIVGGWFAAALVGAGAAGYALRNFRRQAIRPFVMCQLTAGTIGIALMIAAKLAAANRVTPLPLVALRDFLLYFPVCFILEEVSFRGALDSHLHRPGERFGFAAALLGSILWGLWHLPVVPPGARTLGGALALAVVHSLIGVPLAIYWRKSGNLAVTAFTHALIDGVRNGLGLMG